MDGIAIQAASFSVGKSFVVQGLQAAGQPPLTLTSPQHCIEVMTGAVLPVGCDAVIRSEDIELSNGRATCMLPDVSPGVNIHAQGADARLGEQLLNFGQIISPAEVALLASVGKSRVRVFQLPTAAIVSTGDELVPVEVRPEAHQIRQSNVYALQASLKLHGWGCAVYHLPDRAELINDQLGKILATYKVVILSGGVSKGKLDYVPSTLQRLGVQSLFHGVSQRPGKPFWFGTRPEGQVVFALPGNPVSTQVCFYKFILPWMYRQRGAARPNFSAMLTRDVEFKPNLTYFLQVKVSSQQGQLLAEPMPGGGSGDFVNLSQTDGFLELPAGCDVYPAGEAFPYLPFRY
jgi:molybdopterin molybdotransferase